MKGYSDIRVDGCVDYTGEWLRNQSFSAKSMRVCQPFPLMATQIPPLVATSNSPTLSAA